MEAYGLSANPTQISPWIYGCTVYSVGLPLAMGGEPTVNALTYNTYWGVSRGVLLHRYGISWTTLGYAILLSITDSTVRNAFK